MQRQNNPTAEDVKGIFCDVYKFYLKYKDSKNDEEFQALVNESHELYKKYNFDLCKNMLLEVTEVIDNNVKETNSHEE
ncbi:hypothetical protein [Anaerosporobacter sp.]|uniref:hypothetical protein n=1 Tax=Anaerosporobacter sp. TaxID=1872529 RepID=UPI00286EFE0D|nr:hypothetical protein [Anaerosporobacter sp.]